jgi:hypothetical protein
MSEDDSAKAGTDTDTASGSVAPPADPTPSIADSSADAGAAPSEAPAEGAAADGETKSTKRKKKRKKRSEEPPAPEANPLNAEGRERPLFVLAFPSHPELDKLVRAFELGNYAYVREHAPELAERGDDARVREAARELARRIEPDPLVKILLGLSVLLLLGITVWAYQTHGP